MTTFRKLVEEWSKGDPWPVAKEAPTEPRPRFGGFQDQEKIPPRPRFKGFTGVRTTYSQGQVPKFAAPEKYQNHLPGCSLSNDHLGMCNVELPANQKKA